MRTKYHYDHRSPQHPIWHVLIIGSGSLLAIAIVVISVSVIIKHEISNQSNRTSGQPQVVGKVLGDTTALSGVPIKEKTYTITLPEGWHQTGSVFSNVQNSISWESGPVDDGTRYLTVYEDKISPNIAFNRLLPIIVQGQTISYGVLSDNCANFTNPSAQTSNLPTLAKWQKI